ncbi:MAG TPA: hypothetical protein VFX92_02945, partial [Candidatus Krumholzibacteria bacterium]|nr:hypothetical protein [Candidatus Krumholzibacteria bacterium]
MFVQVHPLRRIATTSAVCALLLGIAAPQFAAAQSANTLELQRLSNVYRQQLNDARPPLYYSMMQSPDVAQQIINETEGIELMYFRPNGTPVYFREDNLNAAKTVRTYDVW